MASSRAADYLSIVRSGLQPAAQRPRRIIVVGAGMAGLVAAYELLRAGHDVTILEARPRVGGRIYTVRAPFSNGLYAEAGAMRLPVAYQLTQAYIGKFGLQTTKFTKASPNAFVHFDGRKHLRSEVERDPARLGLDLAGPNEGQTVLKLWAEFVNETVTRLQADEGYWGDLHNMYGDLSLYDFLKSKHCSAEMIATLAMVEGLETLLPTAFPEVLEIELPRVASELVQIVGGMDCLPRAFLPHLQDRILFEAELVALDYTSDAVTLHYKSKGELNQITGDFAILTVPYPALRFVDVIKPFSFGKQAAIRQLYYENSVKVLIECRRRFWEEDEGIFGGSSATDLPIGQIYYPEHGRATGRGVLIGCYNFGREAARWQAHSPEERVDQTLKYMAQIHPQIEKEYEAGISKVWGEDKFAGGITPLFEPGQQGYFYRHMVGPEGPVHFAGEHTALKSGWIEGAVESGLRAAQEVHECSLQV